MSKLGTSLRRAVHREDGVTTLFVAVAIIGLLSMGALVIDFGRIYVERRELQNGATAAALAIGEDCARNLCGAGYDQNAIADNYVDRNAIDGAANPKFVNLDVAAGEVTVTAATEDASGGHILEALLGNITGFAGTEVGAKAKVIWGPLGSKVATIPLIISECEWDRDDPGWPNGGDGDALYNDSPLPPVGPYATITFHDGKTTEGCNANPGHDTDFDGILSGGFGWLDTTGACAALVYDGVVDADPGASPSTGCSPSELQDLLFGTDNAGTIVYIPYFYDLWDVGANGQYEVGDYGAFYTIGYNFGGQYKEILPIGGLTDLPCSGDERCIAGYFLNSVVTDGEIGDGTDNHGLSVFKLVG